MREIHWTFGLLLFIAIQANAQKEVSIGFYNLENLFDTINNEDVRDGEYTPGGSRAWTAERYQNKLDNMSFVINDLGASDKKKRLVALGVCEVENKGVLEDLVSTGKLAKQKWAIIHGDSPDKRGIDNALLYNPKYFKPIAYNYHNANVIRDGERVFTRDILLVEGILTKSDTLYILVNHWPSRWGGQEKSNHLRVQAAKTNKHLVDSILAVNSSAKVLVMGDLNDDPTNESVKKVMNTTTDKGKGNEFLYNPFETIHAGDEGSLKYRGEWNLFDQILLSGGAVTEGIWRYDRAEVFNRCYLIQQKGKYSGNPHRTFGGKKYLNGYSDHLPALVYFKKN